MDIANRHVTALVRFAGAVLLPVAVNVYTRPEAASAQGISVPNPASQASLPGPGIPLGLPAPVAGLRLKPVPVWVASASPGLGVPEAEMARVRAEATAGDANSTSVDSKFEGALPATVKRLSDSHFAINFTTPAPRWCVLHLQGVKGKLLRFDFPDAPLPKWRTLNPVFCYGPDVNVTLAPSPRRASAADVGVIAFNGPAIPDDGASAWKFMPDTWSGGDGGLSCVQRFEQDEAFVALRYPYTPAFRDLMADRASKGGPAAVVSVGKSAQGRALTLFKFGEGDETAKPCVLIYAGEHADEQDGMWVAQGAIEYLNGDDESARALRKSYTVLVIPMLDPDASAAGVHEGIISSFSTERTAPEAALYADWFRAWVDSGKRLDVVINLHNVESGEGPSIAPALMEGNGSRGVLAEDFSANLIERARERSFPVLPGPPPKTRGVSPARLAGWLTTSYGSLGFAYETNVQNPYKHLSLADVRALGELLSDVTAESLSQESAKAFLREVDAMRARREVERRRAAQYLPKETPTILSEEIVGKAWKQGSTEGPDSERAVP